MIRKRRVNNQPRIATPNCVAHADGLGGRERRETIMTRKFIWVGIVLGLIPLYMGSACGGYIGWPGHSTSGGDAKITEEVSVSGAPLETGLWTFYVNYNNIGQQNMKTVS